MAQPVRNLFWVCDNLSLTPGTQLKVEEKQFHSYPLPSEVLYPLPP